MRKDGIAPNEVTLRTVLLALENAPPSPPPKQTRGQTSDIPVVDPAATHARAASGLPEVVVPRSDTQQMHQHQPPQPGGNPESSHALPWEVGRSLLESMARTGGVGSEQEEVGPAGRVFPGPREFSAGLTAACFGRAEWSSIVQVPLNWRTRTLVPGVVKTCMTLCCCRACGMRVAPLSSPLLESNTKVE